MPSTLDYLYLSPHLDDVALSCGGTVHRQAARGMAVAVLTVCAGPPLEALSDYARTLHDRWEQSAHVSAADMVALRKDEDVAALAVLLARPLYLDLPDCVYRRDPHTGGWLYESDVDLFATLHAGDAEHVDAVVDALQGLPDVRPETQVVAPLAVGNHVDHQLTRRAAERWARRAGRDLLYYEDYPYAEREGRLYEVLQPPDAWTPSELHFDEVDLAAKVAAVARYESQLSTFWPDRAAMTQALHDYAWRRGSFDALAERYWCRP